jgi:hypothetical protein
MSSTLGDTGSSGTSLKQQRPQQQTVTTTDNSVQLNGVGGRSDAVTTSRERGLTPSSSTVAGSNPLQPVPTKIVGQSSELSPQPSAGANRQQPAACIDSDSVPGGKAVETLERKVSPSPSVITCKAL